MSMTDEELYEGFTPEQRERYPREAREQYDPELVAESERRVRRMLKGQWQALKVEGEEINEALTGLMDKTPDDPAVQAQIARHFVMIQLVWNST